MLNYDWYQTRTHVVVVLYDNYKTVVLKNNKLLCIDDNEIDLLYSVESFVIHSKEIHLQKIDMIQWFNLIDSKIQNNTGPYISSITNKLKIYDQLCSLHEKEEKESKKGDEAFMSQMKDVFSNGNEEVKHAMNKSYQTSGGRVLSTNWKEVKDANYDKYVNLHPEDYDKDL